MPDESYSIPFGEANFTREGKDITFIAMGQTVDICNKVADTLKKEGKTATVLDLRTLSPLDEDSILEAAEETGKIVIVDGFTGRAMPDRSWQQGLHQAIEAKEGLELTDANETVARMSFQKFFRLYHRLSGMTGTAKEAAGELWRIYDLPVVRIPVNKPCIRNAKKEQFFVTQDEKWTAIVELIKKVHETGQPVLAGTSTVKASEKLSELLAEHGLSFQLLNAVNDSHEASMVKDAGQTGKITVATNMAGRGTDLSLIHI